jgi:hypothetical protein
MAPKAVLCQKRRARTSIMPHDVFLSYASADRAAADAVCAALEARGIVCWMAPRDVPAGADWGEAILTAIGRAHAMVLVLSRHTAASVHVRNEVVTAVSQSLALVPVRIEDCQPGGALRLHLAGSHWLNVYPPPIEQHAEALAAGVRLALAADATIEIPRAQAAAMVAAARASSGRQVQAPPPTAAARPAATPSAPKSTPKATAPAAPAPQPGSGRGGAMALVLVIIALVLALGAAAWFYLPQVRSLLGMGSAAPLAPTVAAAAPAAPPQAESAREAAPAPSPLAGASLPPFPASPPAPTPRAFARLPGPATPAPAPATAQAPATRLLNAADATIRNLYVAPIAQGVGREDWLGSAQITPGNAVLVRAPPGQGCLFNLRVVYIGGRNEDRPGVDLCAAGELRFEGGKALARSSAR